MSQTRPDWSKRHGWIAFTGLREGKASLWFIRGDGSDAHEIQVEGLLAPFYPSWYPDYPAVAVVDFGERDGGVLKRIDAQGQAAIDLTDRREILAGMPRVSPDGKLIAFAGQRNQGKKYNQEHNRIWVLDQEGNLHELDPEQGRTPSWSPDGKRVAFESKRGSPTGSYAIFVIAASGGPARQLTPYELNANHPTWSPDGKKLAFAAPVPAAKDAWGIAVLSIPD